MVPKPHCRTSRESLHYPDGNYPIEVSRHTAYVTIRSGKNLFELKFVHIIFFPKMRGYISNSFSKLQSSKFSNIQSFYRPLLICSCTEQIQDGTFSLLMKASRDVILHGIGIFLPYGADLRGDIEVKGTLLPSHVQNRPEFQKNSNVICIFQEVDICPSNENIKVVEKTQSFQVKIT